MNKKNQLVHKLKDQMEREIELLKSFIGIEEELNGLVKRRDWLHLEKTIDRLNHASSEIESREAKRHQIFSLLRDNVGLNQEDSFQTVLSKLDPPEKSRLDLLQREMKSCLIRVKSLSNGVIYYMRCMQESTRRILDELFPQRRGRIYSNSGQHSEGVNDAMIINHQL
jgi:hypothetical protein